MDALGNPRRTRATCRKSTGGCIARLKREPQLQEVERQLATTTMEPATRRDGACERTIQAHDELLTVFRGTIESVAVLPDGLRFVSGSDDTTCIVYHGLEP